MIKAVIIGFAHMHVNEVALYIKNERDIDLVACADTKAEIKELTKNCVTIGDTNSSERRRQNGK